MSLTFTPRPPLAPPSHLYQPPSMPDDYNSPPLSPLNISPPLSPIGASQPVSPVTFPTDTAMRGTRAVPAPRIFPAHTKLTHVAGDTPYNTPASPRRAPILAPRPCFGGTLGPTEAGTPSSLSTPLGDARPLNAALAMRNRGNSVVSGINGARGVGIPAGKTAEVPHALTPGNTPSSMERISKRMASNLKIGNHTGGVEGVNRIMPSYDRRFSAGLQEVGNKLDEHVQSVLRTPQQTISPSMTRGTPSLLEVDRESNHSSERSQSEKTSKIMR